MNQEKRWSILLLSLSIFTLIFVSALTVVIDPFFHYHKPVTGLEYPLNNQRYQNDGIARNFDYDAMIIGTSMTENFKTSEYNDLFGVNAIKINYSGAQFAELFEAMERAVERNPDLKHVIFAIDQWFLLDGIHMLDVSGEYPTYLYDDQWLNDINYLLNKTVLFDSTLEVLDYTRYGKKTPTFDEYNNWNDDHWFDAELVLRRYNRPPSQPMLPPLPTEEKLRISQMFRDTILQFALDHPDIQFIYFYPPYSVLAWDQYTRQGILDQQIEAYTLVSEVLLEADNIELYSFLTDFDLVSDLNQYKDFQHYSQDINSLMLERFANKEYLLTQENNQAHWEQVREYYTTFDYEGLLSS